MVNLGLLGAGHIANRMADTVRQMNRAGDQTVRLYAVAARDLVRARDFANTYAVERAYGSYDEMLRDPEVTLVYIATPHSHHYEQVMNCLRHGKHVLCEKAFAVNAHQAQEMIQLARQKGLVLSEAIWTRYQPMRGIIQQVLESGAIGTPRMLTANLCYEVTDRNRVVDPALAGGALLDVGIYTLNFAEMVFGKADRVQSFCVKSDRGVDLADSITLFWNDGRLAVLNAGVHCVSDRFGVIYGTRGYLTVENINNPQALRVYSAQHKLVQEIYCPAQLTGYEYEVKETVSCIEEGRIECPSMPHSETLHMMELMDHIRNQWSLQYPCE